LNGIHEQKIDPDSDPDPDTNTDAAVNRDRDRLDRKKQFDARKIIIKIFELASAGMNDV
jgi:hypothetical protein